MFNFLAKALRPRSRYIDIINLNDLYLQTTVDVKNALGEDIVLARNRARFKNRVFVLDFDGDVMATAGHALSQEISVVIEAANPDIDSVLIKVESPGGAVHSYGFVASQINRLKQAGIHVTVSVDKVAASGGYMIASVADKIISAPFAIIGSIGVVAEVPNIYDLLSGLGVKYKQYTAGKFKRTVGMFAPITEEGELKFLTDLNKTHDLFKRHILKHRPSVDIEKVATGEYWYGSEALEIGLVDKIETSDDFIIKRLSDSELIKVVYVADKTFAERMRGAGLSLAESLFIKFITLTLNLGFK